MNKKNFSERGQALIMIALAIIVLVGFTALAIDGGNVFSDRRHAQNAADTSALAAALARVRGQDFEQAGLGRAQDNGYSDNGTNDVEVYLCSDVPTGYPACTALPAGAVPSQYVKVYIKSVVRMFFAPVVGVRTVTNYTDAVARASIPEIVPWFDGKALVSTMEGCKPTGYPHDPFNIGGNSVTVVNGSGIFVNSNCSTAFTVNGNSSSTIVTEGGICVVGGASYNPSTIDPDPTTNCGSTIDPSMYQLPNPTCGTTNGEIDEVSSKNYIARPGNYYNSFPDVSPAGTLTLQKGIYCLHNGLDLQGTWDMRDDGGGVLFAVFGGNVTFNGSSHIDIHAATSTSGGFPEEYLNYLIYVPPDNATTIKITGDNGSHFTGTVLAPTSHVTLEGSGGTIGINSQIIGYSINISGSGNLDLSYDQNKNGVTKTNPSIQVTK